MRPVREVEWFVLADLPGNQDESGLWIAGWNKDDGCGVNWKLDAEL